MKKWLITFCLTGCLGLGNLGHGMEFGQGGVQNAALDAAYEKLLETLEDEEEVISRFHQPYTPEKRHPRHTFDLYSPVENLDGNLPLVIFIHGGGWIGGDKIAGAKAGVFLAKNGFIVASVNYRLLPEVLLSEQVDDALKAIQHLIAEAHHVGADPSNIVLVGHSSGAHVATLIGASSTLKEKNGIPKEAIRGVVGFDAGFYDAQSRLENADTPLKEFWKNALGESETKALSPIEQLKSGEQVPSFWLPFVQGDALRGSQAEKFAKQVIEIGGKAEVHGFAGKNHRTLWTEIGEKEDEVSKKFLDFLRKVTEKKN